MKSSIMRMTLLCGLLAATGLLQAQTQPHILGSHYSPGVEGVKGSSLPPPGFYLRDYNYMYFTDTFKEGPPKFDLFVNVQAPRLIWITGQKILGGYYGMDVIVPLAYQNLDMTGFSGSDFRIGDVFVEPITLSWHPKKADISFGYGLWTPTGSFKTSDPLSPGKGFLTHMLTGGITYYFDTDKAWSLSALSRYEISHERKQTGITPGQYYTLEYALGKTLSKTFEIGAVGYYQAQVNQDGGPDASKAKDSLSAFGPEVSFTITKLGLTTSIRYLREMGASNRPEGNVINFTFTKRLGNSPK